MAIYHSYGEIFSNRGIMGNEKQVPKLGIIWKIKFIGWKNFVFKDHDFC